MTSIKKVDRPIQTERVKMMKIGNFKMDRPLFLGPMAGITDVTYRSICSEFGCDVTVTEMVSAKGLHHEDPKSKDLIRISEGEKIAGIQIFGSDPDIMAEAAETLEAEGNYFLDINMGCPVPKIVKNGEGSALMKDAMLARRIVEKVSGKTKKPVTVKMRIGWDMETVNAVYFASQMEAAGAAAIAVHGRTRDQYYFGSANWDMIRRVKEAVSIPVILSGDVIDGQSAVEALESTGCDGLMIARAAKGNPWIFKQIRHFLKTGSSLEEPDDMERIEMAKRHLIQSLQYKAEHVAVREFRKHCAWYLKGIPHSAGIKNSINQARDAGEILSLLDKLL